MSDISLDKKEKTLLKECLENEINSMKASLFGQDMELTKERDKREKNIQKLIKKITRSETPIKVSSRKGKGRKLQYFVCERIASLFGIKFDQNDDDCPIHSREMGQHGTDVITRGKVKKLFPFSVECKSCENLQIPQWIEQARGNIEKNKSWLLVVKKKSIGQKPIVIMEWESFEELMKEYLKK